MALRSLALVALSLILAAVGYFFAIVVGIYAGLWLHDEKMYYAQGPWWHAFGAVGAALGVLLAWAAWRVVPVSRGRLAPPVTPHMLGVQHLKRGEYAQAVTAFTEAIRLDPDAPNA